MEFVEPMIDAGIERNRKVLFRIKALEGERAYFKGFCGDYDVTLGDETETRRFYRENTGYYNVTQGPMEQKLII